jgi:coenzyme F420-dependent glucose-6-phosphate dehydrogenase
MTTLGYKLSSEERTATQLVGDAVGAEEAGFAFATISDHFHPWLDAQGQSPFVWGVLGGIAHATEQIQVGTGVTCPTVRIHPAIVAQAAATVATMMPGRFFLGVGTGEALNEHILGRPWPHAARRRRMLEEAVNLIRELWSGELVSHEGEFFRADTARLYSIPDEPPPIHVAAAGPGAAELAGRIGDGLISVAPNDEVVEAFHDAGGEGKPTYAEITVAFDRTPEAGLERAASRWPLPAIPGELSQELPLPRHFEQAAERVTPADLEGLVPAGPDPEPYLEVIGRYSKAGFEHIALHQVGEDQAGFIRFARSHLLRG